MIDTGLKLSFQQTCLSITLILALGLLIESIQAQTHLFLVKPGQNFGQSFINGNFNANRKAMVTGGWFKLHSQPPTKVFTISFDSPSPAVSDITRENWLPIGVYFSSSGAGGRRFLPANEWLFIAQYFIIEDTTGDLVPSLKANFYSIPTSSPSGSVTVPIQLTSNGGQYKWMIIEGLEMKELFYYFEEKDSTFLPNDFSSRQTWKKREKVLELMAGITQESPIFKINLNKYFYPKYLLQILDNPNLRAFSYQSDYEKLTVEGLKLENTTYVFRNVIKAAPGVTNSNIRCVHVAFDFTLFPPDPFPASLSQSIGIAFHIDFLTDPNDLNSGISDPPYYVRSMWEKYGNDQFKIDSHRGGGFSGKKARTMPYDNQRAYTSISVRLCNLGNEGKARMRYRIFGTKGTSSKFSPSFSQPIHNSNSKAFDWTKDLSVKVRAELLDKPNSKVYLRSVRIHEGGFDHNYFIGLDISASSTQSCYHKTLIRVNEIQLLECCLLCVDGYYLDGCYCIQLPQPNNVNIDNCVEYAEGMLCRKCDATYSNDRINGNRCVTDPSGCATPLSTDSMGNIYCEPLNLANTLPVCNDFQSFASDKCICSLPHCTDCSKEQCSECDIKNGFYLLRKNNGGVECTKISATTTEFGADPEQPGTLRQCLIPGCSQCLNSYSLCSQCSHTSNGCVETPSTCHSSCLTCDGPSQNQCLTCFSGFLLRTDSSTERTCVLCDQRGEIIEGTACKYYETDCLTHTKDSAYNCLSCERMKDNLNTGLLVKDSNGSCVVCSQQKTDNNIYYYQKIRNNEPICEKCHHTCLSCSGSGERDCLTCPYNPPEKNGFIEYKGYNYCTTCSKKKHPSFYQTVKGSQDSGFHTVCKACHPSCKTCLGGGEYDCLSCPGSKIFYQDPNNSTRHTCVECKTEGGQFRAFVDNLWKCFDCDPKCASCRSLQDCQSCATGYSLSDDNRCIVCDGDRYFTDDQGKCKRCDLSCKNCLGTSDNCTQCFSEKYLYPNNTCGDCQNEIGLGKNEENKDVLRCSKCPENCKICQRVSSCDLCETDKGFYLYQNSTCGTCAEKTLAIFDGRNCQNCLFPCQTCSGPTKSDCLSCTQDYFHKPLNVGSASGKCIKRIYISILGKYFKPDISKLTITFEKEITSAEGSSITSDAEMIVVSSSVSETEQLVAASEKSSPLSSISSLSPVLTVSFEDPILKRDQLIVKLNFKETVKDITFVLRLKRKPSIIDKKDKESYFNEVDIIFGPLSYTVTDFDKALESAAAPASRVVTSVSTLFFIISLPQAFILMKVFQSIDYYVFIDSDNPPNFTKFIQILSNNIMDYVPNWLERFADTEGTPVHPRFSEFGMGIHVFDNLGQYITLLAILGILKAITAFLKWAFRNIKNAKCRKRFSSKLFVTRNQ